MTPEVTAADRERAQVVVAELREVDHYADRLRIVATALATVRAEGVDALVTESGRLAEARRWGEEQRDARLRLAADLARVTESRDGWMAQAEREHELMLAFQARVTALEQEQQYYLMSNMSPQEQQYYLMSNMSPQEQRQRDVIAVLQARVTALEAALRRIQDHVRVSSAQDEWIHDTIEQALAPGAGGTR
jgi:hypothetical protein